MNEAKTVLGQTKGQLSAVQLNETRRV